MSSSDERRVTDVTIPQRSLKRGFIRVEDEVLIHGGASLDGKDQHAQQEDGVDAVGGIATSDHEAKAWIKLYVTAARAVLVTPS